MEYRGDGDWQVRDERGRRKYLTADEQVRFLAVADQQSKPLRALCYVLAYTGCRISEALALTHDHFDAEQRALTFRTLKRRRTWFRVVPIPEPISLLLQALPIKADGHFWTMHRSTAWRRVKSIMDSAGIEGPMACCKGLRHGFGIRAADRSVPPNLIQRWMGHASPSTTAVYLDAVGREERSFAKRMW